MIWRRMARVVVAARAARVEREVRRDADDEQEEREDEVGRRPPVPRRVLERRVDRAPRARIVDEQHAGDRQPAEDVEREQPLAAHRRGARGDRLRCGDRGGRRLGPRGQHGGHELRSTAEESLRCQTLSAQANRYAARRDVLTVALAADVVSGEAHRRGGVLRLGALPHHEQRRVVALLVELAAHLGLQRRVAWIAGTSVPCPGAPRARRRRARSRCRRRRGSARAWAWPP